MLLTPDHVVPLIRGGRNDIANIQPLCFDCNRQKHTDIADYRLTAGAPRATFPTQLALFADMED
jgi:5-methylcytosine-specific restriction endonuclease McrA